ncbi:Uncharacterised protein [Mycobacteroides abscessus subsp. massiliense]|nr:Uncharacterised protein [Mycobacteroides abscessus subsp. massiliense]
MQRIHQLGGQAGVHRDERQHEYEDRGQRNRDVRAGQQTRLGGETGYHPRRRVTGAVLMHDACQQRHIDREPGRAQPEQPLPAPGLSDHRRQHLPQHPGHQVRSGHRADRGSGGTARQRLPEIAQCGRRERASGDTLDYPEQS